MHVTPLQAKPGMRLEVNRYQRIASRSAHRCLALPFQANGLTVLDIFRQLDLEMLAVRENRLDLFSTGGLFQRDIDGCRKIGSLRRAALPCAACAGTATESSAEKIVQDIFGATEAAALLKAAGTGAKFKMAVAAALPEAGERVAMGAAEALPACKALESGLALGVDLAAVELPALVLVAQNFVGLIQFCKTLLRLRIILVLIRVVLLASLRKADFISSGFAVLATPSTL